MTTRDEASVASDALIQDANAQGEAHAAQNTQWPSINLLAGHTAPRAMTSKDSSSPDAKLLATLPEKRQTFYSSVQWTADGTSIIVCSSDHDISSFVLPADLLERGEEITLSPQGTTHLPEPTQVIEPAPYFSLADPSSQAYLVGCRDHPIQLYSAFPDTDIYATPLCSYKLIRRETEEYITPSSLLWENSGTHFICGSANRLDYFDVTRYGADGPTLTIPTIPSRRHISKGSGVGMRGTVSSLSAANSADMFSVLAAGTRTRWLGLYDIHRTDKTIANWSIAGAAEQNFKMDLQGCGIVQTGWSPCGRYLIVNERHASGLLVYDIRSTGQLLAILNGRTPNRQQTLSFDVFAGESSESAAFEVWGGTRDGSVAVWENIGLHAEIIEPSSRWQAHEAPVGGTALHPTGSVAVTCSGGWSYPAGDSESGDESETNGNLESGALVYDESALKIWSIGATTY